MNQRIKLLAEQATTYIEPTATSGEGWIFDKEKFAELIVRECTLIVSAIDRAQLRSGEYVDPAEMITKHFGVEE